MVSETLSFSPPRSRMPSTDLQKSTTHELMQRDEGRVAFGNAMSGSDSLSRIARTHLKAMRLAKAVDAVQGLSLVSRVSTAPEITATRTISLCLVVFLSNKFAVS